MLGHAGFIFLGLRLLVQQPLSSWDRLRSGLFLAEDQKKTCSTGRSTQVGVSRYPVNLIFARLHVPKGKGHRQSLGMQEMWTREHTSSFVFFFHRWSFHSREWTRRPRGVEGVRQAQTAAKVCKRALIVLLPLSPMRRPSKSTGRCVGAPAEQALHLQLANVSLLPFLHRRMCLGRSSNGEKRFWADGSF